MENTVYTTAELREIFQWLHCYNTERFRKQIRALVRHGYIREVKLGYEVIRIPQGDIPLTKERL